MEAIVSILLKMICASHLKELNYFYGVHAKIFRLFGLFEHLKTSLNFSQFSIQFYLKRDTFHCYFSFTQYKNCHFQSAVKDLCCTCDLTNLWRSDTNLLASGATAKIVKWASSNKQIQSIIFKKKEEKKFKG